MRAGRCPFLISSLIMNKLALLPLIWVCSFGVVASETLSGGKTTVKKSGANAFSQPANNLPLSKRLDFSVGNSFFKNPWVPAPSSTDARDGLGPLFNTNGCQNCHIKDGRGHAPQHENDLAVSMLLRMSIPAVTSQQKAIYEKLGVVPEPTYGDQLQDFALPNVKPEGQIAITYTPVNVQFSDGETVTLRQPHVEVKDLGYGELHPDTMFSPRIAPAMVGLGLLESVDAQDILAWEDPDDLDNNGISGRANWVWDKSGDNIALGRFGWKAGQPSLMQQNAAAFNGDIGLTSSLFPESNCQASQTVCQRMPNGGEPEVSDNVLKFVEFYSQHLAVPSRRVSDKVQVKIGGELFKTLGCEGCHRKKMQSGVREGLPALSNQTFYPYTDLLLHDMGEGLADNRPEAMANGREWRTAPLWGIGYTKEVSGVENYLHDGRARSLMEAILWHGGEAQSARDAVLTLDKSERDALIAFLKSL